MFPTLLMLSASLAAPSPADAERLAGACSSGDAAACGELGARHAGGLGVVQDLEKAAALTRQGCDGGHIESCTHLGVFTLAGQGVNRDEASAARILGAACERGSLRACHFLGVQHLLGLGLPTNPEKAWTLMRPACEGGFTEACGYLGGMLEKGFGVPKDLTQAAKMRDRACTGGDLYSCTQLGMLLQDDNGPGKDLVRAGVLYLKACRGEEAQGCLLLGDLVATGVLADTMGTDPAGIFARAAEVAGPSCAAGEIVDCMNQAEALQKAGQVPEATRAWQALLPRLEHGCIAGDVRACGFLEEVHRDGLGRPANPVAADQARARACALGDATACERGAPAR